MAAVVADTHAIVWCVSDSSRLSAAARTALEEAARAGDAIYVTSITLVEVCYLVEKGKLPQALLDRLNDAIADPALALRLVDLDHATARNVAKIPRDTVPDMPDRIIAATALTLNLPLVSRDRKIQAAPIVTIW